MTMFITPAVIDARCPQLHGSCSQRHLARLGATVAHHQGVSLLVTLVAMALNVIVNLSLQCFHQHPPCTLARDLIQP
jgi:hypothetical protein